MGSLISKTYTETVCNFCKRKDIFKKQVTHKTQPEIYKKIRNKTYICDKCKIIADATNFRHQKIIGYVDQT